MYGFKRRKIAHRLKQNTQKRHDYTQALSDKLKHFSNFVAYYNQILFSHSKPVVMEFFNLITDAGLKDIYQKIADLTMFVLIIASTLKLENQVLNVFNLL